MKAVLQEIVRDLVDNPSALSLTELSGTHTVIFELRCDKADVGKIIGKNGKTISAIRTVLNAISSKDGRKAVFEVIE